MTNCVFRSINIDIWKHSLQYCLSWPLDPISNIILILRKASLFRLMSPKNVATSCHSWSRRNSESCMNAAWNNYKQTWLDVRDAGFSIQSPEYCFRKKCCISTSWEQGARMRLNHFPGMRLKPWQARKWDMHGDAGQCIEIKTWLVVVCSLYQASQEVKLLQKLHRRSESSDVEYMSNTIIQVSTLSGTCLYVKAHTFGFLCADALLFKCLQLCVCMLCCVWWLHGSPLALLSFQAARLKITKSLSPQRNFTRKSAMLSVSYRGQRSPSFRSVPSDNHFVPPEKKLTFLSIFCSGWKYD